MGSPCRAAGAGQGWGSEVPSNLSSSTNKQNNSRKKKKKRKKSDFDPVLEIVLENDDSAETERHRSAGRRSMEALQPNPLSVDT